MRGLTDKRVLITGGASGIGAATAARFLEEGSAVCVLDRDPKAREREGHSIFYKDPAGTVFHTYSCYDRGNDKLNLHYHYLDLVPKGRDEDGRGPHWVRRRDEYDRWLEC